MRQHTSFKARRAAAAAGRGIALLAASLALSSPIYAASEYTILGAGSRPCGAWLQARSQAVPESGVMQSWLLGYITSFNAHNLTLTSDIAAGTNADGIFAWVDDYCSAHPIDSVARAAASLIGVLRSSSQAR
ncbi:MAG TPA: hypothetical protein VET89_04235 [Stellaceae bacterium]|nr:hypothetical protein [Stellaceae bacterium]